MPEKIQKNISNCRKIGEPGIGPWIEFKSNFMRFFQANRIDLCHRGDIYGRKIKKKVTISKRTVLNCKMDRKSVDHKSFLDPILDSKFAKKLQKLPCKNSAKKQPSKKWLVWYSVPFSAWKSSNFKAFHVDFELLRASFSDVFLAFFFGLKFEVFLSKNIIKAETRKVAFIS